MTDGCTQGTLEKSKLVSFYSSKVLIIITIIIIIIINIIITIITIIINSPLMVLNLSYALSLEFWS